MTNIKSYLVSYLSLFDSFLNPEAQILNSWMHEEVEKFISYYYPDHKEYENMNKGKPTWRMTPKLVEIHQKFEILDSFNSFKTRNNSIRCPLSRIQEMLYQSYFSSPLDLLNLTSKM